MTIADNGSAEKPPEPAAAAQPVEQADPPPPPPGEGAAAADPPPADPPPPADEARKVPADLVEAERLSALERERWLREQIEKDHELLLLVGRTVVGGLTQESSMRRFWRWLIDDLRSERREQAALLTGHADEGSLVRAWRWLQARRRGSSQNLA